MDWSKGVAGLFGVRESRIDPSILTKLPYDSFISGWIFIFPASKVVVFRSIRLSRDKELFMLRSDAC